MKNVLTLLLALLVSACVGGGSRNASPSVVYDFGLPAMRLVGEDNWSGLALEVRSPVWFESLNVDYRLAYDDPLRHREYALSRWAGPPRALLTQGLKQQLGTVNAGGSPAANCLLRVELQEFSQVLDSPQSSRGVLQASVSLIDAQGQVIQELQVAIERPAPTADAQGGVNALVAAGTELGQQLVDWLASLGNDNVIAGCRSR